MLLQLFNNVHFFALQRALTVSMQISALSNAIKHVLWKGDNWNHGKTSILHLGDEETKVKKQRLYLLCMEQALLRDI